MNEIYLHIHMQLVWPRFFQNFGRTEMEKRRKKEKSKEEKRAEENKERERGIID